MKLLVTVGRNVCNGKKYGYYVRISRKTGVRTAAGTGVFHLSKRPKPCLMLMLSRATAPEEAPPRSSPFVDSSHEGVVVQDPGATLIRLPFTVPFDLKVGRQLVEASFSSFSGYLRLDLPGRVRPAK